MAENNIINNLPAWISLTEWTSFFDPTITEQYPTIEDFVRSTKQQELSADQKKELIQLVENEITTFVDKIMHANYLFMEKKNNYGESGEQRVSISFCRLLLNIPHSRSVTQFDADIFRRRVEEKRHEYHFDHLADNEIFDLVRLTRLNLFGHQFRDADKITEELSPVLKFIGSDKILMAGFYGQDISYLWGKADFSRDGNFCIYHMTNEIARTPNNVLSIAAMIGQTHICMRVEACRTIFYNKWVKMFRYDQREKRALLNDVYSNISEAIKEKCLELYGVKTEQEAITIEDEFVNDMVNIILQHELGHNISQLKKEWLDAYAIGEGVKIYGENIISLIKEFLADWAVDSDQWPQKGAVKYCIDIALCDKDVRRATRLMYMYISDSWFYDTGETYMFLHTDMMMAFVTKYVNNDGSIDWEGLARDIYNPESKETIRESIYGFMEDIFFKMALNVENTVRKGTFLVENEVLNYEQMAYEVLVIVKNDGVAIDHDDLYFKNYFWAKMFPNIKTFSPTTYDSVKKYIDYHTTEALKLIFHKVASQEIAERYQYDLRKYICEQMKARGIYVESKPMKITEILKLVMEDLFFSANEQKDAAKLFNNILKDESLKFKTSTTGDPSPFWECLQEMLRRTGWGKLDQGITLSSEGLQDTKDNVQFVSTRLDNLVERINKETITEIRILKVRKELITPEQLENILRDKVCLDGDTLLEKIWHIDYSDDVGNHFIEIFLPTKIGFPCPNTTNAIRRINEELTGKPSSAITKKLLLRLGKKYIEQS